MMNTSKELPLYLGSTDFPPHLDDGLIKGSIYAIEVESVTTRLCLMHQALMLNLKREIPCVLITRLTLGEFFSHLDPRTIEFFLDAIEAEKLRVFSMTGDYAKNIFRFGPERFVQELESFNMPCGSFVMIDHADSLFTIEDSTLAAEQARTYRQWMQRSENIGLFFFPCPADGSSHHVYFKDLSDHFRGLAKLCIAQEGMEIRVDFWALQGATIMAKRFKIALGEDNQIQTTPSLVMNRRSAHRPEKQKTQRSVYAFPDGQKLTETSEQGISEAGRADSGLALSTGRWQYRSIQPKLMLGTFGTTLCAKRRRKVHHESHAMPLIFKTENEHSGYRYRNRYNFEQRTTH